jgi:hypothetical protein
MYGEDNNENFGSVKFAWIRIQAFGWPMYSSTVVEYILFDYCTVLHSEYRIIYTTQVPSLLYWGGLMTEVYHDLRRGYGPMSLIFSIRRSKGGDVPMAVF